MLRHAIVVQLLLAVLAVDLGAQESAGRDQPASERPEFVPLTFDGTSELEYPYSPVLEIDEGTIDFYVAIGWRDGALGHQPCVLALSRGDRETRFGILIGEAGDSIGLWNGTAYDDVEFQFQPGTFYHVALLTRGSRTVVRIDGQAIGVLNVGYGNTTGAPLFVGAAGDGYDPFIGAIHNIRIWNRVLGVEELAAVAKQAGPPADVAVAKGLVAFSWFTSKNERDFRFADYRQKSELIVDESAGWIRSLGDARKAAAAKGGVVVACIARHQSDLDHLSVIFSDSWQRVAQKCAPFLVTKGSPLLDSGGSLAGIDSPALVVLDGQSKPRAVVRSPRPDVLERAIQDTLEVKRLETQKDRSNDEKLRLFLLQNTSSAPTDDALKNGEASFRSPGLTADTQDRYATWRRGAVIQRFLKGLGTTLRRRGDDEVATRLRPQRLAYALWNTGKQPKSTEHDVAIWTAAGDPEVLADTEVDFAFLAAHGALNQVDDETATEIGALIAPLATWDSMIAHRWDALSTRQALLKETAPDGATDGENR